MRNKLMLAIACLTFSSGILCSALPSLAEQSTVKGPHRQILAMAGFTDSEKPKVISFTADWCPTCEQLKPALERAASRYGGEVDFISVNIDDERNKDIVRLYRVKGVPEVVFVNQRGRVVSTFMGNEPKQVKIGMQKLLSDEPATSIAASSSSTQ